MIDNDYFNSAQDYLEFYGLSDAAISYELVPFESGRFKLAGHIFKPADYKATVVLIHGFMGHTGLMGKFIMELTDSGFAVAAYDLPGHGLSNGERTAINDFSQYTDSLSDFLDMIGVPKNVIARSPDVSGRQSNLPNSKKRDCFAPEGLAMTNRGSIEQKLGGPYHLMGFSTGASAIMEYLFADPSTSLRTGKEDCFDKVILAAPLVHSAHWSLAKFSYCMYKPFVKDVARVYRKVSSDKDFLRFIQYEDPMSARRVSLKWVKALFKWNKKIADVPLSDRKILVIQGKKDNTVAWRYNLKFIQSKFSNVQIKFIEKARHELFNESTELRSQVFSQIREYLDETPTGN